MSNQCRARNRRTAKRQNRRVERRVAGAGAAAAIAEWQQGEEQLAWAFFGQRWVDIWHLVTPTGRIACGAAPAHPSLNGRFEKPYLQDGHLVCRRCTKLRPYRLRCQRDRQQIGFLLRYLHSGDRIGVDWAYAQGHTSYFTVVSSTPSKAVLRDHAGLTMRLTAQQILDGHARITSPDDLLFWSVTEKEDASWRAVQRFWDQAA
ncbi:hypothetical protein [Streptomyces sp. SM12]|uniref:hypothetical protein n=1 Tax=Streptomyces sp. SM12 TaxID=1071602 RepID=UPI000CD5A583|nr:hypothetical protein [Streptomyces sp. SM12]